MNILALDLALSNVGWATSIDGTVRYGTETGPGKLCGVERLSQWEHWLHYRLQARYDLAVIEGYSFGSKGRAVFSIAEWGGVARLALWAHQIPTVEVSPAVLKKYATGKGNSPKPTMRMELYKRAGIDVSDDNAVDAYWLLAAAMEAAGTPLVSMPKANVEALGKVAWPTVAASTWECW